MARPAELGDLGLEGPTLLAEDEAARSEDPRRRPEELLPEGRVLALEVLLRDHWATDAWAPIGPTPSRFRVNRNSWSAREEGPPAADRTLARARFT